MLKLPFKHKHTEVIDPVPVWPVIRAQTGEGLQACRLLTEPREAQTARMMDSCWECVGGGWCWGSGSDGRAGVFFTVMSALQLEPQECCVRQVRVRECDRSVWPFVTMWKHYAHVYMEFDWSSWCRSLFRFIHHLVVFAAAVNPPAQKVDSLLITEVFLVSVCVFKHGKYTVLQPKKLLKSLKQKLQRWMIWVAQRTLPATFRSSG